MTYLIWYFIRMSYGKFILSGWHPSPLLSHPNEIADFDFSQHPAALQCFRTFLTHCWFRSWLRNVLGHNQGKNWWPYLRHNIQLICMFSFLSDEISHLRPMLNHYVHFSFHGSQTIFFRDKSYQIFDPENWMVWQRSKLMATFEAWCSIDLFFLSPQQVFFFWYRANQIFVPQNSTSRSLQQSCLWSAALAVLVMATV